jgi:hypothetical protein
MAYQAFRLMVFCHTCPSVRAGIAQINTEIAFCCLFIHFITVCLHREKKCGEGDFLF